MTTRIHVRTEYRTTGVFEVVNEPVSEDSFPHEAADMILKFYPDAYRWIRNAEQA